MNSKLNYYYYHQQNTDLNNYVMQRFVDNFNVIINEQEMKYFCFPATLF